MAFSIWDNHEMGRARALPFQMPSRLWDLLKLLLSYFVSFATLSNTKDLLDRQTCQGILCVSA